MVGTIICEVVTIICDIGIINVRFYLLKVRYPYGYRRITLITLCGFLNNILLGVVGAYDAFFGY
jgi:Co/Zn/Cd efflux system component